jgi:pimeloyl-ACP methyl ester carboxylesterase
MSRFVLVHGGWHGAWCWKPLIDELEARGHQTTAMDLPIEDASATFDTYADVVAASMPKRRDEQVVLVGHSYGGQTIPLVPAKDRPVDALVYLCAMPPVPGLTFVDQLRSEQTMLSRDHVLGLGPASPEGSRGWSDPDLARHFMYADCTDQAVSWAFERLRPQAPPTSAPCPLVSYPDLPTFYIACTDDQLINPRWGERFAKEKLNAGFIEMPGSHSPFMSRPGQLASAFEDIGRQVRR